MWQTVQESPLPYGSTVCNNQAKRAATYVQTCCVSQRRVPLKCRRLRIVVITHVVRIITCKHEEVLPKITSLLIPAHHCLSAVMVGKDPYTMQQLCVHKICKLWPCFNLGTKWQSLMIMFVLVLFPVLTGWDKSKPTENTGCRDRIFRDHIMK